MDIRVGRAPKDGITLAFDQTKVTLSLAETKILLLELTKLLLPQTTAAPNPAAKAEQLAASIKKGKNLGIQKLLRMADHDDLLVLLKFGEADKELAAKVYGNMTAKSRQIYAEDLAYRFKGGVPEDLLGKVATRLTAAVRNLEEEGTI